MADSSLLSVVVGGLLTMGGEIIAGGVTWAVNLFQANEEKKKRRADKLEELVMAIYEHEH
jgi:hypothetical protein